MTPALALLALTAAQVAVETPAPRPHALDLGVYAGAFLPSSQTGLSVEGADTLGLGRAAMNFALRLSYMPSTWVGVETEAGYVNIDAAVEGAEMYTLRGHVLAQYPASIAPFVLVGAGVLGVTTPEEATGSDMDLAVHWGAGAKYYFSSEVSARLEGRHVLSGGLEGGLAHSFEVLAGLAFTLVSI